MGKSENGPGMQDCAMYLNQIQTGTNSQVSILIEVAEKDGGGTLSYALVACSRDLTVDGPAWSCSVTGKWPCKKHKTFESCLFWALGSVDAEIGRMTFQEVLGLT
jgi:hypothetical protein